MTVRVTTLKGADAGVYYVEQLPNYYLDSGEPRGIWFGDGARQLGVSGEVGDEAFLAVMAGMDPRRPDRDLGRRYDDKSVRGFDVTASAPKSVSVLWALGDEHIRRAVLDAHDTAVRELAGWIEAHAHTRYRIGGEVAVVDAEGIVAVAFRQHTSRALDPQLHTHLVIANRVKSPDGRWLALDAPSDQTRSADPVGVVPRVVAGRADSPARCPLASTRARDRRDRRCPRGVAGRVLDPHRGGGPSDRRQVRPVHRNDGP